MSYIGSNHQSYIGNNPRTITGDELANNVISANNIVDNSVEYSKLNSVVTDLSNTIFDTANSGFIQANAAFLHANSGFNFGNTTFTFANAAFLHANSGFEFGNTTFTFANSAFLQANTARNQANSAYAQANTAQSTAASAQSSASTALSTAAAKVTNVNNQGAGNVWHLSKNQTRKSYGEHGSGWSYDWTGSHTQGTFCKTMRGGGHNATDVPFELMISMADEKATTLAGEISEPYSAEFEPAQLKYFYWNATRDSWSQRESLYLSESVTSGNRDAIGLYEMRYGDPNSWADPNIYYYGHTPYSDTVILKNSATFATAGPTIVTGTVGNGTKLNIRLNGQRARITFRLTYAGGSTEETVSASDYGGAYFSWVNDSGSVATFTYSYFITGDDLDRTFIKIYLTRASTAYGALTDTAMTNDRYGTAWQYYWQNQRVYDGDLDAPSLDGGQSGLTFRERRDRLYTTKAMTLPSKAGVYSIGVKVEINKGLDDLQGGKETANVAHIWQATAGSGQIQVRMNASTQYERRIYLTALNPSDGSALVTDLKIWQFDNDDPEDIWFHWSWNPLDTVAPGRFYVNELMVWQTTTNPLQSLTQFNVGSTTDGTSNGFTGVLKMLSLMPESWGVHNVQGSVAADWDLQPLDGSFSGGLNGSTYNGGAIETVMSARTKVPQHCYLHSGTSTPSTIFSHATRWYFNGTCFNTGTSAAGYANPLTLDVVTETDSSTVTISSGWPSWGGVYLVTGTPIQTVRNVYCTVSMGDKSFTLNTHNGDYNTATAGGLQSLTFRRVNGGSSDGYNGGNSGTYRTEENPPSVTKVSAGTSVYFGNNLGCATGLGNATNAYSTPGVFAQFTLACSAGDGGADPPTTAGNPHLRTTNTAANNGNVRRLMNMLARGKKPTIVGTGIQAASDDYFHTYVTGVGWDHYGTGLHKIDLSNNNSANPTASNYTCFYVPHNSDSYDNEIDRTGGEYTHGRVVCSYNYSTFSTGGGSAASSTNEVALEYNHGYIKVARNTPPKGVYDSGIFRATAGTTSRRMAINYAATGYLINYGTEAILGRTAFPTITQLTNQMTANGLSVATTAGNFYRIIIIPLSTNFTVS